MSESRIVWRRFSTGLSFIGFGVFFFLSTQDLLHRGFWLDALALWPVCLIALGLRVMFDRSKTPWAVLLSPLIIMAALTYLALRGAEPSSTDWQTVQAARDPQAASWSLQASLALSNFNLRTGPLPSGILLQGRIAPADHGSVRVSDRGSSPRVYLRSDRWEIGHLYFRPDRRDHWEVEVADDLPMALRLSTAFAEGELDLQALEVTRVDLDGAFNDFTLRLGTPPTDIVVSLEGAFNRVKLLVPEDTPVRVSTDGFINLVDRRSNTRSLSGPAYQLRADGAFNQIVVRSE